MWLNQTNSNQTNDYRLNQTYNRFEIDESFIEHSKGNENSKTKSNGRENPFRDQYKHEDDSKSRKKKPRDWNPSKKLNSKEGSCISYQISGLFPSRNSVFICIFVCAAETALNELRKQKRMHKHILVTGVPKIGRSENLRSIFRKICDEIGVRIESKDIVHIERSFNGVIVEFRDMKTKRVIKKRASQHVISCRDILRASKCPNLNIKIVDLLTPHFLNIIRYANQAIANKLIASVNITSDGALVRRDADRDGRHFLLLDELKEYIHQLEARENLDH